MTPTQTPAQLGYSMPAEWEPHVGTWLSWPRPEGISFPDKYEPVPGVYAEFIKALVEVEDVNINVWHAEMEQWVRGLLATHKVPMARVRFHHFPTYEPWCRDHGPIFLKRRKDGRDERAIVDWGFNAWGGKYPPYDLDDAVPQHVAKLRGLPLFSPGIVMEGGSIEVNGRGTLLTTEEWVLRAALSISRSTPRIPLREHPSAEWRAFESPRGVFCNLQPNGGVCESDNVLYAVRRDSASLVPMATMPGHRNEWDYAKLIDVWLARDGATCFARSLLCEGFIATADGQWRSGTFSQPKSLKRRTVLNSASPCGPPRRFRVQR